MIDLSIVHLEFETNEVGQDRSTPCLGFDGRSSLTWSWAYDRESMRCTDKSGIRQQ